MTQSADQTTGIIGKNERLIRGAAQIIAPGAYWSDPGTNHEQIEAIAKAESLVALFDNENNNWKPIESAPKTETLSKAVYILAFDPELAGPKDSDMGVCVCWWEPAQHAWFSDSAEDINPTLWLMQITAPAIRK